MISIHRKLTKKGSVVMSVRDDPTADLRTNEHDLFYIWGRHLGEIDVPEMRVL